MKARTKAARRRAKRLRPDITLAGGESVPSRLTGRDRRGTQESPEDALRTVTHARIRHGVSPDDALRPMAGDPLGLCLLELCSPDAARELWQTWCALSASHRTYRTRILAGPGDPANAALPMLSEPMQTDQSPRVDTRDGDQRDADARASWERWEARIDALPIPQHRWAIRGALDGFGGPHWHEGRPTARGKSAVQALRGLAQ